VTARAPALPERFVYPDNANPARQLGPSACQLIERLATENDGWDTRGSRVIAPQASDSWSGAGPGSSPLLGALINEYLRAA
jgi:hypothetical protein